MLNVKLKEYAENKNITLYDVIDRVDLSKFEISRYWHDKNKEVKTCDINKILKGLGCDYEDIIEYVDTRVHINIKGVVVSDIKDIGNYTVKYVIEYGVGSKGYIYINNKAAIQHHMIDHPEEIYFIESNLNDEAFLKFIDEVAEEEGTSATEILAYINETIFSKFMSRGNCNFLTSSRLISFDKSYLNKVVDESRIRLLNNYKFSQKKNGIRLVFST